MNVELRKIRQQVVIGTKLVLVGGIIFAVGAIVYMNGPNLGFEEQSLLSLVIMVSFILWVVGAIYFGVAGDQWLILRTEYQSKQKLMPTIIMTRTNHMVN